MTYIPNAARLPLVAIMDWASRKVPAWQLSNTMEADFCVAALEEAIARHGKPDIFNTDQGSQFTSFAFTNTLREAGIRISMDGRGRWMGNVSIERLWRSFKYECVFLNVFETSSEVRTGTGRWMAITMPIAHTPPLGQHQLLFTNQVDWIANIPSDASKRLVIIANCQITGSELVSVFSTKLHIQAFRAEAGLCRERLRG